MNKQALIESIVLRMINPDNKEWGMNIHCFDWVPGVGLNGVYYAWKYTGDRRYWDALESWAQEHLKEAYTLKTVNSTAPMSTILSLYEENGNQEYLKVCTDIADYILREAPRTREGGLEHTVTEKVPGFNEQLWADTLFMVGIFLAKMGKITGNYAYTEEAAKQLVIHHKVLKDKKSGLFYHGWNCEQQNWMSAVRWGRANAWITVSTVEMLEMLPDEFEGRDEVITSLVEQVAELKYVQRNNGMFGTVLDDPDAYGETSATAGIAAGIKKGIKLGYIPKEYHIIAEKAEKAVVERINENGEVMEVSYGTPIMASAEEYRTIPNHLPVLYGQALALMMLCQ